MIRRMFSRTLRIRVAAQDDTCPHCGSALGRDAEEGRRLGTGSLSDGVFCSLECMSSFHDEYYRDRIEQGFPSAS